MDRTAATLAEGDLAGFSNCLLHELDTHRRTVGERQWVDSDIPQLRQVEAFKVLLEDPMTAWAVRKPRGYPGDAPLIDFMYQHKSVTPLIEQASDLGKVLHQCWINSPAALAVRARKQLFEDKIAALHDRGEGVRVLALASGHFREIEGVIDRLIPPADGPTIVCLDQDKESCDVVEGYGRPDLIRVINAPVTSVRHLSGQKFDLIYAAGLNDYLNDRTVQRIYKMLVPLLAPGGEIVFPNFLHSAPNRASMELLQDWFLIYRDEREIHDLLARLEGIDAKSITYAEDESGSIGWSNCRSTQNLRP